MNKEILMISNNLELLSNRNYRGRFERIALTAIFEESRRIPFDDIRDCILDYSVEKMIKLARGVGRHDIARIYRYISEKDY